MHTDSRGHKLTTDSAQAAAIFSRTIEMFVQRQIDVVPTLQQAIDADPDCTLAQATYGLLLHGARNASFNNTMKDALSKAQATASRCSNREQQYVNALQHACDGNLYGMVKSLECVITDHPTDLLALVLAQGELFWLGDMDYSNRLSELTATHWHEDLPGYPEFLSVRAFDLEESNQFKDAEHYGRKSVALRPSNVWGAHAVAHVLLMQGRHGEGLNWLTDKQNNWAQTNQMKFHLWWHQCLFHLEQGEHDAVLAHYDQHIRNRDDALVAAMPDLYIDLQNGASLLWRLEQAGVNVADRWQEMSALVKARLDDMHSPFTSAHYAVILAATNQYDDCHKLIAHMQEFASSSDHTLAARFADGAIPAAQGAIAHRQGQYQQALDIMLPKRQTLWQMGGSHAQQDLFHQIMVDAAVKCANKSVAATLLREIEMLGFIEPTQNVGYAAAGKLINQS